MESGKPEVKFRIVKNITTELKKFTSSYEFDKVFLIVDENTKPKCLPALADDLPCPENNIIEIRSGENHKDLKTATRIWDFLSQNSVDRKSLIINLGGGMLCDIGAFVASTIKRGIDYFNVPTTLLAMIDASIGGKTGINFRGLKNEIGLINQPENVFIYLDFLKTLDIENIISGYGEMLKYALVYDKDNWFNLKELSPLNIKDDLMTELIYKSANIKKHFVENDPFERNIRKALNFGHTFGHAFESFCINSPDTLIHGKAITYGMICESFLSYKHAGLEKASFFDISQYITKIFGKIKISRKNFGKYIDLMKHDKKNEMNKINCTLIPQIGKFSINNYFENNEILEALDFLENI